MKNLQLDKKKAIKLYKTSSPEWKEILEENFGIGLFSGNILDRISSFADICIEDGTTEEKFMQKCNDDNLPPDEVAGRQIKLISKVLSQGVKYDYDNTNQEKWAPLFSGGAAGFGFSLSSCTITYTFTSIGSRFAYHNKKTSDFAGKTFTSIYKSFNI